MKPNPSPCPSTSSASSLPLRWMFKPAAHTVR